MCGSCMAESNYNTEATPRAGTSTSWNMITSASLPREMPNWNTHTAIMEETWIYYSGEGKSWGRSSAVGRGCCWNLLGLLWTLKRDSSSDTAVHSFLCFTWKTLQGGHYGFSFCWLYLMWQLLPPHCHVLFLEDSCLWSEWALGQEDWPSGWRDCSTPDPGCTRLTPSPIAQGLVQMWM